MVVALSLIHVHGEPCFELLSLPLCGHPSQPWIYSRICFSLLSLRATISSHQEQFMKNPLMGCICCASMSSCRLKHLNLGGSLFMPFL